MNKAGLWEGIKNWLIKSIQESYNTFDGKKIIEAETMQMVLNKMKEYEKQFLQ